MTSLKPGISALQLEQQIGLRFATTWLPLGKLRRATVNPERTLLEGDIEMDDVWVRGVQVGLKGGHQRAGRTALQIIVAVERRGAALGRVRMAVLPNANVRHTSAAAGVDRVLSNLKTWLWGTHKGVGSDHLDAYFDEFSFRFNRSRNQAAGFATLLGLTTTITHSTAADITPMSREGETKRRGRSTGQTGAVHRNPPPLPKGEKAQRRRRPKKPAFGRDARADLNRAAVSPQRRRGPGRLPAPRPTRRRPPRPQGPLRRQSRRGCRGRPTVAQ
jgi:hypothetical protein